jgi:two-component sensor histidine kinase
MIGGVATQAATAGARPARHMRGLKARLAFILGVVLVPALLYSCWQAFEAYAERQAQRAMTAATMLRVVASYHADFFERTRSFLLHLAAEPAIRAAELPACAARLIEARNRSTDYLNLFVLDRQGAVRCGSAAGPPMPGPGFLGKLREGAPVAVSEVLRRPTGGDTIMVGVPIRERATAGFAGAMTATVNLRSLQRAIANIDLPPDAVAYLGDGNGRTLAEPGDGSDARQTLPAERFWRLRSDPLDTQTVLGGDGVRRDYHVAAVGGEDLFVVVGLPSPPSFAWLQRELVIGVFAPTLMLGLAMVTIWIASDYLVIRHVRTLGVAARAYSRGELDLRLDLAAAPIEFQELAHTLARMAGRVRRREDELRASLAEKDLLLREVHHRVKNNLQIVTSLLNLSAQRLQAPQARDAVRQAQMRVAAMTLVHRKLYETDDIREIDLASFLEDLCGMLEEVNDGHRGAVQVLVEAEPTNVAPDQAIPLALLVTEAVSNAFKHAFPADRPGRIEVRLGNGELGARLSIADDGIGLAGGDRSGGMGVTLMRMLAKQVGGTLRLVEGGGTRLEVDFPLTPPAPTKPRPAAPAQPTAQAS